MTRAGTCVTSPTRVRTFPVRMEARVVRIANNRRTTSVTVCQDGRAKTVLRSPSISHPAWQTSPFSSSAPSSPSFYWAASSAWACCVSWRDKNEADEARTVRRARNIVIRESR
uniref:Uncharacterized protein n=1 Tax=Cacopsylla melanoneura TaxID=428564 RepID=A0A8D9ENR1_9HEMI